MPGIPTNSAAPIFVSTAVHFREPVFSAMVIRARSTLVNLRPKSSLDVAPAYPIRALTSVMPKATISAETLFPSERVTERLDRSKPKPPLMVAILNRSTVAWP